MAKQSREIGHKSKFTWVRVMKFSDFVTMRVLKFRRDRLHDTLHDNFTRRSRVKAWMKENQGMKVLSSMVKVCNKNFLGEDKTNTFIKLTDF